MHHYIQINFLIYNQYNQYKRLVIIMVIIQTLDKTDRYHKMIRASNVHKPINLSENPLPRLIISVSKRVVS